MKAERKNDRIPLLILVGPTAVGKSALALKIAMKLHTHIISADSAQVYKKLNIGTAKPSPADQKLVKHHLIDLVEPDQGYSVADYQKDAFKIIKKLRLEGKLPFIVGGTGLYIKAVTDRFAFGEKGADSDLRVTLEQEASTDGLDKLYKRLQSVDPYAASRIHPNDRRRIIRALEVYTLEGKPISEQVFRTGLRESPFEKRIYGLNIIRETLYNNIERRVDLMMEQGFLEEVSGLYEIGYDEGDPGMQILGYSQLLAHIKGEINREETLIEIKKQTRNLAKRQLTWFRREEGIQWVDLNDHSSFNRIAENICREVKDMLL
ncbi:MAG: tRNA (adenosine(37)-N6)-dimethylallyltransferase MiaA [Bacillota bacterium]